jgi:porin
MQVVEHGHRQVRRVIVAMATIALLHEAAAAADNAPNKDAAPTSTAQSVPDALRQLTDPGGWRSRLEQAGLQFAFTYYGDGFVNPRGGVTQGSGYDGRFGIIIDADMEKLAGWSGASVHASIQQIHGSQFSAARLQNFALVSGIEAPPSTRLFNLWIEQKIGSDVNLRLGQFSAAQEFLVSQTAALFVNATFGWPMLPAQDLPSGGPAYPEATPGVRVTFTPTDQLTLRAAMFNGDPAGPGPGNPVDRDPYGLAFRLRDPPLLIAEVAYAWNQGTSSLQENPHQEGGGRRLRGPGRKSCRVLSSSAPGCIPANSPINVSTAWADCSPYPARRHCDIPAISDSTASSTRRCGALPATVRVSSACSLALWGRRPIATSSTSIWTRE